MRISDWSSDVCSSDLNPAQAGFFDGRNNPAGRPGEARSGGLERLDACGQAALVAGGLVLVDQAAGAETVEPRVGRLEGFLGADGLLGFERLEVFLAGGAQPRTLAVVALVAPDGLPGRLLRGLDVGHNRSAEPTSELQSLMRTS